MRELLKKILATGWLDHKLSCELEELLAQSEQEPVGYLYKQMDCNGEWATIFKVDKPYITWHDVKDIVPVYTAPPKREPFGPEERQRISKAYSTRAEQVAFEEGIIFAKILYGIGGE